MRTTYDDDWYSRDGYIDHNVTLLVTPRVLVSWLDCFSIAMQNCLLQYVRQYRMSYARHTVMRPQPHFRTYMQWCPRQ